MSEDLKIPVSMPGGEKAKRDLKQIADGQERIGRKGKEAGEKTKKGAQESRQAVDELGRSVGLNVGAFANWKLAAVAAVAAIAAAIKRSIEEMNAWRQAMRQAYAEFVQVTRQPMTTRLASLRGQTPATVAAWARGAAEESLITPEAAVEAAFELESALGTKLGGQIFPSAAKVMGAEGVGGKTVAGLAIAAQEAGLARRPEEFKAFYAKVIGYAKGARVSPEQVGQVATRLLPAAVRAGIDPDYFLAQVAAMSMRIGEPGALTTAIEQMIRAAGQPSGPVQELGARLGRAPTAPEIMELQGTLLSEAMARGGPQAATAAAERLGIPAEVGTTYAKAFDPAVQQRLRQIRAEQAGATWETTVGETFARVSGTPEAGMYRAQVGAKSAEFEAGRQQALWATLLKEAERGVTRARIAGEDIPGVWEDAPGGQERAKRRLAGLGVVKALRALAEREGLPEDVREQAREGARLAERSLPDWQVVDWTEGFYAEQAQFLAEHGVTINDIQIGGTRNVNADKTDPAGKPRQPVGQY